MSDLYNVKCILERKLSEVQKDRNNLTPDERRELFEVQRLSERIFAEAKDLRANWIDFTFREVSFDYLPELPKPLEGDWMEGRNLRLKYTPPEIAYPSSELTSRMLSVALGKVETKEAPDGKCYIHSWTPVEISSVPYPADLSLIHHPEPEWLKVSMLVVLTIFAVMTALKLFGII